jgi:drug/metabolite transporter (DMT)-like permease
MTPRRDRLDLLAFAIMFTLCLTWGFNQVLAKTANHGISPILQAGLRSLGAGLLVWAWSASRGIRLFDRDGTLVPGIVAGLLFAGEFALIFVGLEFTTASRTVIFIYTSPFVVALGVHLFVPGEKLHFVQVLGLAGAFVGVAIAFSSGLSLPTYRQLIGDAMELGGAVLWGATTVLVKASRLARVSPNKTLFYQLAVSAIVLPPLSWLLGEPGVFAPTPVVLGAFAIQTVIVAFVSYLAWFWLVAHYPAGRLAAFTFLTPLFGVMAGWAILAEPLSSDLIVALVLVGCGIYVVNRAPPKPPLPATSPGGAR